MNRVPTLAAQQADLLAALWQPQLADAMKGVAPWADRERAAGPNGLKRGLQAYRSNAQALAARALAAAYPVVAQLLDDNFAPLARQCWRAHPPARGDLAHWGASLPALIESLPDLADQEPYLADVARLEWALHEMATAADVPVDAASFALLATREPASLCLRLAAGAGTLASAWPVVSIVGAHTVGEPALEEAGRRLRAGHAETALFWRDGLRPRVREALPGEAPFIAALQENRTLADAWSAAPDLDVAAWLAPAAHSGLLVQVHVFDTEMNR